MTGQNPAAGSALILPEGRAGQLLAMAIPAVLVAIICLVVLQPAFQWYQMRQRDITFKQQEILRINAMRQLAPLMRHEWTALQSATGDRQLFLAGDSDALAGANLQAAVSSLITQEDASISSIALSPVQPVNGLREVALTVTLTSTWKVLITLLGAINVADPGMIVTDLDITNPTQEDIRQDIPLQISLTLAAFRKP